MVRDRRDLRRRLQALAARQSGYFSAAQAIEVGYTYQAQKYHVDHGNWVRIDRGIFRLPDWPPGEHDTMVRWTLWSKHRAVVSHGSALVVHDLGDVNPALVDLTVPPGSRMDADGIVLHHEELSDSDVSEFEGFRVTTPVRTLLDVAAGRLEVDQLATAVDDGVRAGVVTRRMLLAEAERFGAHAALRLERALAMIET